MATGRIISILWDSLILALQERELTEPVVNPQVWDTVPDQQVQPTVGSADIVQNGASDEKTEITQSNQLGISGLVQGAGRVEVVDTTEPTVGLTRTTALRLLGMVVVTGNIGDQIHGPAEQLLEKHVGGGQDGGLLHKLAQVMNGLADTGSILLAGLGDKDHVTSKVTSGLVVLAVGDLP